MALSAAKLICLALLAAAAEGALSQGNPKNSNAVKKVIEMLQDLDAKIVAEGEQEEKTFQKFKWWYEETKEEKEGDIQSGQDRQEELEANIQQYTNEKDNLITDIATFQDDIAGLNDDIAEAAATRKAEHATYEKTNAEVEHAVKAAGQALDAIKASNEVGSFLQMGEQVKNVRHVALLAESMGFGDEEGLKALNNAASSDSDSEGDWKQPVLDMLEELQENFRTSDQSGDMDESNAENAYRMQDQALKNSVASKERSLEQAEADKAERIRLLAESNEDLKSTKDTLADDTKYLADTNLMFAEKQATFDQRNATRMEELGALREATQIVEDTMAKGRPTLNKSSDAFFFYEVASHSAATPEVLAAAEAEAESMEEETGVFSAPLAFLQRHFERRHYSSHKRHLLRAPSSEHKAAHGLAAVQLHSEEHRKLSKEQQALLQFLDQKAAETKSSKLVLLARRVATGKDPFVKIKEFISNLIADLQEKASKAQGKKMECDKKIGESEAKRDRAYKKSQVLNAAMIEGEARKDKLTEDISLLTTELATLADRTANATALRNEESDENRIDIAEAEEALSGVQQALAVMNDFYSKAKDNEVAEVNASSAALLRVEPMPDAGFKNYEANQGSQAASKGIVGMLEVIESDFKRTISDTKAEEDQAEKGHKAFLDETAVSTAAKTEAKTLKENQKTQTLDKLSQDESRLGQEISSLKTAVLELKAHAEDCGEGAGFEERKQNRQAEMDALKGAIEFFDDFIATNR